jgi:hypothetical protein
MGNIIEHRMTSSIDLADLVGDLELITAQIGPSGELYVLATTKPLDYRQVDRGGFSFAKIKSDKPHDYAVFRIDDWNTIRYDIKDQLWNFHAVQPLPAGDLLLVCGRSRNAGYGGIDLNGQVFSEDGQWRREFLLGDGIQDIQMTTDGCIWTSYFDEGVFGNYGWNDPIGRSGLIQWDKNGNKLYEFDPPSPLGMICDCYALNVVSKNETWCYYYRPFPLVQIQNGRVGNYWHSPIAGSHTFAIWKDTVLFQGGYDNRDEYVLLLLKDKHQMEETARYRFVDEEGAPIPIGCHLSARGSQIVFVSDTKCYRLYLYEIGN